jgi:hypothetical protein
VSDCDGIVDIYQNHKQVESPAEAAALAVKSGPIPSKGHARPEQYRRIAPIRSFVRRLLRFIEGLLYRREL